MYFIYVYINYIYKLHTQIYREKERQRGGGRKKVVSATLTVNITKNMP